MNGIGHSIIIFIFFVLTALSRCGNGWQAVWIYNIPLVNVNASRPEEGTEIQISNLHRISEIKRYIKSPYVVSGGQVKSPLTCPTDGLISLQLDRKKHLAGGGGSCGTIVQA